MIKSSGEECWSECRLERWLALPMEEFYLVNSPKNEASLANAVALDALAGLFVCTYAYAQEWQNEMRRYFGQGFSQNNKSDERFGYVF